LFLKIAKIQDFYAYLFLGYVLDFTANELAAKFGDVEQVSPLIIEVT